MPVDGSPGELLFELAQERYEGSLLCVGTCVGWLAVLIQTSDIAHSNGIGIVPDAVSALLFNGSAIKNLSLLVDNEVVSDFLETALAVPSCKVGHRNHLLREGGSAMHDDFIYCSHL